MWKIIFSWLILISVSNSDIQYECSAKCNGISFTNRDRIKVTRIYTIENESINTLNDLNYKAQQEIKEYCYNNWSAHYNKPGRGAGANNVDCKYKSGGVSSSSYSSSSSSSSASEFWGNVGKIVIGLGKARLNDNSEPSPHDDRLDIEPSYGFIKNKCDYPMKVLVHYKTYNKNKKWKSNWWEIKSKGNIIIPELKSGVEFYYYAESINNDYTIEGTYNKTINGISYNMEKGSQYFISDFYRGLELFGATKKKEGLSIKEKCLQSNGNWVWDNNKWNCQ